MSSFKQQFLLYLKLSSAFRRAVKYLFVVVVFALLAPLLANDQPLMVYDLQGLHFPALRTSAVPQNFDNSIIQLNAPISYSPGVSDFNNSGYIGPFDQQFDSNDKAEQVTKNFFCRHWLGTTLRGCDVLSGLIHGAGISLYVGIMAALLSGVIGIFFGGFAAWHKVSGKKISILHLIVFILFFVFLLNVIFNVNASFILKVMILLLFLGLFVLISKMLKKSTLSNYAISIPIDFVEAQLNVLFSSFPKTLFIIAVGGFIIPGWTGLVFLLAITGWMEISRTARAEFLRIIALNYVDAAKMSGARFVNVLLKHLVPNALPAIITVLVFNVAICMLTEASLSFLGIGIPSDSVTWGTLLAEGRDYYKAWWLVVFPGFMITATIYSLLIVGEAFRDGKID